MTQLIAQNLQKTYRSRQVVKNVSLRVDSGEVVGLLGPNGAGKTTSFYMIVGLVAVDGGDVFVDQTRITHKPMHTRSRLGIGYLPQETSIFRKLTVKQNILAILQLRRDLNEAKRQAKLQQLLQEFNLEPLQQVKGFSLSGGETRRVEIARALAIDPKFMLLDEPFAGIDPISILDIKRIIQHLVSKGIGVLITDHNVRETLDICHRATIVNNGSILTEGTPQEVLNHQKVREVYLGQEFHF